MFKYLSLVRLSYALSKLYTKVKSNFAAKNHSHTKSQITDFPSSLPANGGDADTVNGHTVNSDVPSGAKFTDVNTTYTLTKSGSTIYLKGSDGSQTTVSDSNTTYGMASQSNDGLMSNDDKIKLDGIATGANNYIHPTSAGNKHIPSGGSNGQVLKYGGSSGTATWGTISTTDTYGDYVKE